MEANLNTDKKKRLPLIKGSIAEWTRMDSCFQGTLFCKVKTSVFVNILKALVHMVMN